MGELQFAKQYLTTLDNKNTKFQPDHVFDPQTFGVRIPYTLPKFPHPPYPSPVPLANSSTANAPSSTTTAPSTFEPPPGSQPSINLTLTSPRNPLLNLSIPCSPDTPISSLKTSIQTHLGGPTILPDVSKIKIIHNKKPIPSSKPTLADAFAGTDAEGKSDVKLSVMILGGAPDPPAPQAQTPSTTQSATTPAAAAATTGTTTKTVQDEVQPNVGPPSEQAQAQAQSQTQQADELTTPEFWNDLQSFLSQRLNSVERATELRGTFERAWRSGTSRP